MRGVIKNDELEIRAVLDLPRFFGILILVLFNLGFFLDSQLDIGLNLIERIILVSIIDLLAIIQLLLQFKYEVNRLMKRISD